MSIDNKSTRKKGANMAHFYEIVKHNAQKFANERKETVYITKAQRKTDYTIIFKAEQLTPHYEIIEAVQPESEAATC